METAKEGDTSASAEEEDMLERSKRRGKNQVDMETASPKAPRRSYRDSVLSHDRRRDLMGAEIDDSEVSDGDLIEECTDSTWVGIGMMKEEKIEARRPWRNSLIVKLMGQTIGYHYLLVGSRRCGAHRTTLCSST